MSISDAQYAAWLERSGNHRCALFRLTLLGAAVGSPSGSQEYHAFVSNRPYVTRATDTPANRIFDECVIDVPSFTRAMGEQLEGRSTQSAGDLVISNEYTIDATGAVLTAGVREAWLSYNWDGRRLEQWIGDPSWAFADFRKVLDGTIVDIFDAGAYKLGFKLGDKGALLDRSVMTALLGGDGPEADGIMPLAFGSILNATPKLIDSLNRIYRHSHTSATEAPQYTGVVYEAGSPLTSTADLDSASAATNLLTTLAPHGYVEFTRIQIYPAGPAVLPAPLVGSTDYWVSASGLAANDFKVAATRGGAAIDLTTNGSSLPGNVTILSFGWTDVNIPFVGASGFQLAGNPLGEITCDIEGMIVFGGSPAVETAGDIANFLLTSDLTNTPLTSGDIDAASLAAFVALCPQRLALYLTEKTTFAEVLDRLVLSVGGWWGFSRAGLLQFGRLDLPVAGAAVYSFIDDDVARRSMRLEKRILPRAEIRITGNVTWTTQTTVNGDVSAYDRARLARPAVEYVGSAAVTTWDTDPTNHRGALRPDPYPTLLVDAGQAEADRLATLFQYPTAIESFQTHQVVYLLGLGDRIYVASTRYTGYGVIVGATERIKGRSEVKFFRQLPDVYPTADIA